jgi:formate-nitrite transporter family protein
MMKRDVSLDNSGGPQPSSSEGGVHEPRAEDAGADSPHLDEGQRGQAADHSSPRALVLHEIIREEGEEALRRTVGALIWSSLAAGLSMGFSFLTESALRAGLPDTPGRALISSFGYSAGFVLVILGRQQLFTESTLTVVLPVLTRRNWRTALSALRFWAVVLLGNLFGTWVFAAILHIRNVFDPAVATALGDVSRAALGNGGFGPTVIRAIFAGWLIALMVWLLPSARSGRLLTVLVITYVVAVTKLSHVIAGSAEVAYSVLNGNVGIGDYLTRFLCPTLIGNILGGVSLVALLNHAAIAPEINRSD